MQGLAFSINLSQQLHNSNRMLEVFFSSPNILCFSPQGNRRTVMFTVLPHGLESILNVYFFSASHVYEFLLNLHVQLCTIINPYECSGVLDKSQ